MIGAPSPMTVLMRSLQSILRSRILFAAEYAAQARFERSSAGAQLRDLLLGADQEGAQPRPCECRERCRQSQKKYAPATITIVIISTVIEIAVP